MTAGRDPMPLLPDAAMRSAARRVYGEDPVGYEAGRPDYPELVFDRLRTDFGLHVGARVLEVGPGTGRATGVLLTEGAVVTGVEPDPALTDHLRRRFAGAPFRLLETDLETTDLPDRSFDLVVAAMAWHWVDPSIGLPAMGRVLRPGGWAVLWWTMFTDPTRPDAFRDATQHLVPLAPAQHPDGRPSFELDADGWRHALAVVAGLSDVRFERLPWTATLDAAAVRGLYASMVLVRRLPPADQARILDELERIARDDFGGVVERPMVTALHAARRPG